MRRTDLTHDWQQHTMRTVLTGILVILVLGVSLGAAIGFLLTRAFDAAGVDELTRDLSRPRATEQVAAR
jgi:hypothetical protein